LTQELKPLRVKEIEKGAELKKSCEKLGEYSEGYRDWEIWMCELIDDTIILVEHGYSHTSARHWTNEIWIPPEMRKDLAKRLLSPV